MKTRRWLLVTFMLLAAGCAAPPELGGGGKPAAKSDDRSSTPAVAPITNLDECATRLHDISGALLLYYQKNRRLPANLDELKGLAGMFQSLEFSCPVSSQPYVYIPTGISAPEPNARIVLHDPTPAHDHHRWAVSIVEPDSPQGALITKVIALPASGYRTR